MIKALSRIIRYVPAIGYAIGLFYIFFLAPRRRGPAIPWSNRPFNLIPFKSKIDYLKMHVGHSGRADYEFFLDIFGNIFLFIPFAFLMIMLGIFPRPNRVMVIALLVSILVETIQFLFSIGVADIDDVILNIIGAFFGVLLFNYIQKRYLHMLRT